jgi:D-amino-acid dehydrogenase
MTAEQTTADDPKTALIIGGGIIGLTTAYDLARNGLNVTVIDAGPVERRASTATAGIIGGSSVIPWAHASLWGKLPRMLLDRSKPLYVSWPPPSGLYDFVLKSRKASRPETFKHSAAGLANLGLKGRDAWEDLLSDLPKAKALFQQTGCLFYYGTEKERQADADDLVLRRSFGMDIDDLDAPDVLSRLPNVIRPVVGGSFVNTAAHVTDPVSLQNCLVDAIRDLGGKFVSTNVTRLETAGNKITAVVTHAGSDSADVIVLAAGHGGSKLASDVGLKIPMAPAWGVSVTFENPSIDLKIPMLVLSDGFAVTPSDQGLRVSGLLQIGGAGKAKTMQAHLIELAKALFGDFKYTGIKTVTGPRPLTADSLPVLGADPKYQNLYHNFGHGHWGLTQASISARIICGLIAGRPAGVDINAYCPDRFQ